AAFVFAVVACLRAHIRLPGAVPRRHGCVSGKNRGCGEGADRSASNNRGGGAARVRENVREYRGEGPSGNWVETENIRLGVARGGRRGAVARVRKRCVGRGEVALGDCGPAGVFENSRGDRRAHARVLFGRRAIGGGVGRVFLVGGSTDLSGIWPDGIIARN